MKTQLLLVEDDAAVHGALAEVLQDEGYEVVHAFTPTDAIQAPQVHPQIGLVLLDLNLAGENGWDVFERLTSQHPALPIVIITARSDQRALAEAAGVGALMEKPLNIPLLLDLIARLLAEPPAAHVARLAGYPSGSPDFTARESVVESPAAAKRTRPERPASASPTPTVAGSRRTANVSTSSHAL